MDITQNAEEKRDTMSKKIAVINDLSGFGRCSLTAALPVISVMGVQPCPLPTAVLSAQTGYPSFYCDDYTEKMEYFRQEWEKMGVCFDGIYTGFVGSEEQVQQIFHFLQTFYNKEDTETFLLVDPIMGDEGKRFSFCTDALLNDMKQLVARADIVTPNLMELCLLTDVDYHTVAMEIEERRECTTKVIRMLAEKLLANGCKTVIVTGIRFWDEDEKLIKIGNLTVTKERAVMSAFPYIGGSFSGTGDLFASVVAGGVARGDDVFQTVELAGIFIWKAMKDSSEANVQRNEGADFEKYLGMLIK